MGIKIYAMLLLSASVLLGCRTTQNSKVKSVESCPATPVVINTSTVNLVSFGGVNYFTPKLKASDVQVLLRTDENAMTHDFREFGEILLKIEPTDESKHQAETLSKHGVLFKNALENGNAVVMYHVAGGRKHIATISERQALVPLNKYEAQIETTLAENSPLLVAYANYEFPCGKIDLGVIEAPQGKRTGKRGTFEYVSYYSAKTEKQAYDLMEQQVGKTEAEQKNVTRKILEIYGNEPTAFDLLMLSKLNLTAEQAINEIMDNGIPLSQWAYTPVNQIGDSLYNIHQEKSPIRMRNDLDELREKNRFQNKLKSRILADRSTLRDKYEVRRHIDF